MADPSRRRLFDGRRSCHRHFDYSPCRTTTAYSSIPFSIQLIVIINTGGWIFILHCFPARTRPGNAFKTAVFRPRGLTAWGRSLSRPFPGRIPLVKNLVHIRHSGGCAYGTAGGCFGGATTGQATKGTAAQRGQRECPPKAPPRSHRCLR